MSGDLSADFTPPTGSFDPTPPRSGAEAPTRPVVPKNHRRIMRLAEALAAASYNVCHDGEHSDSRAAEKIEKQARAELLAALKEEYAAFSGRLAAMEAKLAELSATRAAVAGATTTGGTGK